MLKKLFLLSIALLGMTSAFAVDCPSPSQLQNLELTNTYAWGTGTYVYGPANDIKSIFGVTSTGTSHDVRLRFDGTTANTMFFRIQGSTNLPAVTLANIQNSSFYVEDNGGTSNVYRNGVLLAGSATAAQSVPLAANLFIGTWNNAGNPQYVSEKTITAAHVGAVLPDPEGFYNALNALNIALGVT